MHMLIGYNRKLAWVALPAILWACLGLAFALGASRGEPPPFAMHVGLPPGGVVVPGRLIQLVETEDDLHLVSGLPEHVLHKFDDWPAKLPFDLPEKLTVEFATLQPLPPDEQPAPVFTLLDPDAEIRQLPRSKQVVITREFIVVVSLFDTRLLPRGEDTEQRLRKLLEERQRWYPDQEKGGRGDQNRLDRRDWLERFKQRGRDPDEMMPPSDEFLAPPDGGIPPPDEPHPPQDNPGPPPDEGGPPPR